MKRVEKEKIEDSFINGIVAAHQLAKDARTKIEALEHRLSELEKSWQQLSRELKNDRD